MMRKSIFALAALSLAPVPAMAETSGPEFPALSIEATIVDQCEKNAQAAKAHRNVQDTFTACVRGEAEKIGKLGKIGKIEKWATDVLAADREF
jgi:hypothetical protein